MFDIYLSPPHPSGFEDSFSGLNWATPATPDVDAFECELSQATGAAHVAALASGTAALHLALVLLGVGPGDEVLCQSSTYVATANPIRYQGATPVFVDSEPTTWNLCPDALETALRDRMARGKRPKAIIAVDSYGMPAQFDRLLAICDQYGVPLIEDAAEALGSTYNGQACGTFGRLGVWSFNRNKIITSFGGGALVSTDELLIRKARFLAAQSREKAPYYIHTETGFNYQLSPVSAGIGRAQLVALDERVAQRRANFRHYQQLLGHLPGIDFQPEPEYARSNRWLTALTINPIDTDGLTPECLRLALLAERIEARRVWNPMHRQPLFAGCPVYGTQVSEQLFAMGLCLPSGSTLTPADRDRVADVIHQLWHEREKAGA
ncbi:MAG: aminotransferase class I/II-fold pyridoxal phosphate-dependent enzyme [Bacteroidetes bacterium]|nr:aminotransferase class I/II-fold pyridoxal phosphate-dependent enzyme [Fibrella sp.]